MCAMWNDTSSNMERRAPFINPVFPFCHDMPQSANNNVYAPQPPYSSASAVFPSNSTRRDSSPYSDIGAPPPTAPPYGNHLFPNPYGQPEPPFRGRERSPNQNRWPTDTDTSLQPHAPSPGYGYPPRGASPLNIPRTPQLTMPTHYGGPAPSPGFQMPFPNTPDPSPFASDTSFPTGRSEHVGSLSPPYSPDYGSSQSSMNSAQPH
ncbi:hypothetical protein FRC02_007652, partial [Tulasnella sp. 418]